MTRQQLIDAIEKYRPYNEQEEMDKPLILNWIKNEKDAFLRENKIAHITASAWVVNKDRSKVLMVYHNIYHSWCPAGEPCRRGDRSVVGCHPGSERRSRYFQGLSCIRRDLFPGITYCRWSCKKGKYVSSHLHLNVTYLLEADPKENVSVKADENSGVAWFSPEEALGKSTEPWFVEHVYKKLINKVKMDTM